MLAHYSHIRLEAKRRALDALSGRPSEGGTGGGLEGSYGTKHETKELPEVFPLPQLVEKIGGADGTRTRDLLRDR